MSFKVIDNRLLKKNTEIWEKVSSLMNIEFDSLFIYLFYFTISKKYNTIVAIVIV